MNLDAELTKILDQLHAAQDGARDIRADMLAYLIGAAIDEAVDVQNRVVELPLCFPAGMPRDEG